jgi:serine-type D-Ala-D-Ala carboxypeptidase (penicillin-binding protein 5/6)
VVVLAVAFLLVPAAVAQHEPLVHLGGPLDAHGITVTAKGAILIDAGDGSVLWAKHAHQRLFIASTTKIMTAIVAMEHLRPHDLVTIDTSVRRVAPVTEGLRPGEQVEAWKLFYGALLFSGNDTALSLAIGAGGTRSRFVAMMNEKAKTLGLKDSHFRSPSGLIDRDNYSTPWDMASLARYAMWNPRFRAVVRTRVKRVPWAAPTYAKIYVNHNHLIGTYPGANGVKTGWTTLAKHCLVASVRRGDVWLIAVVLGADDMYGDAKKLFAYGFSTRS